MRRGWKAVRIQGTVETLPNYCRRIYMTDGSMLLNAWCVIPSCMSIQELIWFDHKDTVPQKNSRHAIGQKCLRRHDACVMYCKFNNYRTKSGGSTLGTMRFMLTGSPRKTGQVGRGGE